MHPADVVAALKKAKISQSRIAEKLGVSNASVSATLLGKSRSASIEKEIANQLGLPLDVLWPQHYGGPETGGVELIPPYRRGVGITVQKAEEQLIDLWRRMGFDEQQEAMRVMKALAEGAPPDAKPGSEGIAGMRGRNPEAQNTVSVGTNSGQVNTASKVINRGKL